jgi:hypothetical protein
MCIHFFGTPGILYNKVVLDYRLIHFINYRKHNKDASPKNYNLLLLSFSIFL